MDVQISWTREAGVLVGAVAGRVDSANSSAFHDVVDEGVEEGEQNLILECSGLSYISSAGLRVLLATAKRFQGPDQTIGMCALADPIRSVVALSGFDKIIPVHGSVADALAAITGEEHADDADGGGDYQDAFGVPIPLRSPIDLNVVGDNIVHMAAFTVEKHEFANGDLPADTRARVLKEVEDVLWRMYKLREQRRQQLLAEAFRAAAEALKEALDGA